jgi:hypothetical protein
VSRELALIGAFPAARRLVVCHDTGWPCARWDSAYDPELLDGDAVFRPGMLSPFSAVPVDDYGLELPFVDERESSARRGVLTAVEDFLRDSPHYGHLKFTPFYGLSVLWDTRQFSEGDNDRLVSLPAHAGLNAGIIEKLELNRLMLLISLQRAGRIWKQQQSYIGELEKRLQRSSARDA